MAKVKSGPLNQEELETLRKLRDDGYDIEEIGRIMNRRPALLSDYCVSHLGVLPKTKGDTKNMLKKREFYEDLRRQFTSEEMKVFEFHYTNLFQQFQDDVFHTEEGQIIDYAKLEILINRCLMRQNHAREEIEDVQNQLAHEKAAPPDVRDLERINFLMQTLGALNAGNQNTLREYNDLMKQKQDILKNVKGTRDQRIKSLEDNKQTFGALFAKIATDSEYRAKVGAEMEKFRIAMYREKDRLSQEIRFNDGFYDKPLLNSETILEEEKTTETDQ
jgi:hypothetical protein